jgi:hypothetical protein
MYGVKWMLMNESLAIRAKLHGEWNRNSTDAYSFDKDDHEDTVANFMQFCMDPEHRSKLGEKMSGGQLLQLFQFSHKYQCETLLNWTVSELHCLLDRIISIYRETREGDFKNLSEITENIGDLFDDIETCSVSCELLINHIVHAVFVYANKQRVGPKEYKNDAKTLVRTLVTHGSKAVHKYINTNNPVHKFRVSLNGLDAGYYVDDFDIIWQCIDIDTIRADILEDLLIDKNETYVLIKLVGRLKDLENSLEDMKTSLEKQTKNSNTSPATHAEECSTKSAKIEVDDKHCIGMIHDSSSSSSSAMDYIK